MSLARIFEDRDTRAPPGLPAAPWCPCRSGSAQGLAWAGEQAGDGFPSSQDLAELQ